VFLPASHCSNNQTPTPFPHRRKKGKEETKKYWLLAWPITAVGI
jgi:hypothetical protein